MSARSHCVLVDVMRVRDRTNGDRARALPVAASVAMVGKAGRPLDGGGSGSVDRFVAV